MSQEEIEAIMSSYGRYSVVKRTAKLVSRKCNLRVAFYLNP
ncbi:hypothetical protein [Sulfurospirillum diekertiae]|nr:hypothetical protein [Sulfurospirillum diekertiae]